MRAGLALAAIIAGSAVLAASAPASLRPCSTKGVHPAVSRLRAYHVSCATARKLPGAAAAAAKKHGYNTHVLHVDGFTCHVLRFKSRPPYAGDCEGHGTVDWKYA